MGADVHTGGVGCLILHAFREPALIVDVTYDDLVLNSVETVRNRDTSREMGLKWG